MAYPRSITGCRPYREDTTYLIYWPHHEERSIFEFEPADNPKCEFYIRLKRWNLGRDALKKNNATQEDIEKYEDSYLAVDANMERDKRQSTSSSDKSELVYLHLT